MPPDNDGVGLRVPGHGLPHGVLEVGLEARVVDDGDDQLLVVAHHALLDGVVDSLGL